MARSSSYTYDPKTGSWSKSTTSDTSKSPSSTGGSSNGGSSSGNNSSSNNGSNKSGNNNSSSKGAGSNLTSTSSSKNTSEGDTEKKYNNIEIKTLSGNLAFIVTEQTIKLRAGDTVKLRGLGKSLSGDYYVQNVTRQISSNGYSHTATVIRTDYGSKLNMETTTSKKPEPEKKKEVQPAPAKSTARTYTVKKGDSLWAIARKVYGKGSLWQKIYNANVGVAGKPYTKHGVTYSLIYPGQVLNIP